jgi:hypothetical protein
MRLICATSSHASALAMDFSQSFANLRHRPSQARVRSIQIRNRTESQATELTQQVLDQALRSSPNSRDRP